MILNNSITFSPFLGGKWSGEATRGHGFGAGEQDIKIEPSENCYELAKFYISQMDHQALVAIVHKHIDTLRRLDHSRNRDNFQTELQNEHWKIEQFQGGLRKSDQ